MEKENKPTLVTCYYEVKSKHPHDNYKIWINNLLLNIESNIIIFTSSNLETYFINLKEQNPKINIKIIIKEYEDLEIFKKYNIWEQQYSIDPTPLIRTKECYIIWNSKMNLVKEAITLNPFNSNKFIWNDIGSMRDYNYTHLLHNYPKSENISNDKLDIVNLQTFSNPNQIYFQNEAYLSGAIFAASANTFLQIIPIFYQIFEEYLEKGLFIGCDQQIICTMYMKYPDLFNLITPNENIIDSWFYLYHHFSK